MLYAKPTSKVITRPDTTVINQSIPGTIRSTNNILLNYLRQSYRYRLNFDLENDPYATNQGRNYEGDHIVLTALDDKSADAYAAGDVKFLVGTDELVLNDPYPMDLDKGSATSAAIEVYPVNLGTGEGEYLEGYLRYFLTVVNPIEPAETTAVFGRGVFSRTAFGQGPIMKEVGATPDLVQLNLGLKNQIGFNSSLVIQLHVISTLTGTLYNEYFQFEEDN